MLNRKSNAGILPCTRVVGENTNNGGIFHASILKHRNTWNLPLYFSGSVAYEFRDVLESLCSQYELEIGDVIKSPMDGLIKYYKGLL